MPGPYERGARSGGQLATCHHDIQIVSGDLLEYFDHSVFEGARTIEGQIQYILRGVTKVIDSKHIPRDAEGNYDPTVPCIAIDTLPYARGINPWPQAEEARKIQTKKANRFYFMHGLIQKIAAEHGIKIRQGIDWDMDGDFFDQNFDDLPHWELVRLDWPRLILPPDLLSQANEALRTRGLREYVNP